ncbi:MAG: RNA 2',3'-cyclic phosphodiesterase [Gammaproteobacteria bacterium]|nr:RNA 2',3'-cyclic phosphodiesterase [Gammaproteobacteria bacterium]
MSDGNNHRLFFALWPDGITRQKIVEEFNQSAQAETPGRLMKAGNIHMTLHFIGNVSQQLLKCMDDAAKNVSAKKFHLQINHYGYFYQPKVLWMGVEKIPEALKHLHDKLEIALRQCGYKADRRIFSPHITLKRKALNPGPLETFPAIDWSVDSFALVESIPVVDGVKYEVIRSYDLVEPKNV